MLYTTISRERLRGAFGLDVSGSANHRKGCIKLCRTTDFFFFFLMAWQDRLGIGLQLQKHSGTEVSPSSGDVL